MLTSASTFTSVSIQASDDLSGGPGGFVRFIEWTSSDGTGYVSFPLNGTLNADDQANLSALNEIYATHGFFPDSNGDPADLYMYGYTSLDHLIRKLFNPFSYDDYQRWASSKGNSALHVETEYMLDAATGKLTSMVEHDMIQQYRVPEGSHYPYPLARWSAASTSNVGMALELRLDDGEAIRDAGLDTLPPVLAMLQWLRGIQDSALTKPTGTDADADASFKQDVDPTTPLLPGQSNRYAQHLTGGASDLYSFEYLRLEAFHSVDGNVILLRYLFVRIGADIDRLVDKLNKFFFDTTIELPINGQALQSTQKGNPEQMLHGKGLQGQRQSVELVGGDVVENIEGRRTRLSGNTSEVSYVEDLPVIPGVSGDELLLPLLAKQGIVRISDLVADINIGLEVAEVLIPYEREGKTWSLIHEGTQHNAHVTGAGGGLLITIRPTEFVGITVIRGRQGRSDIVFTSVPFREFDNQLAGAAPLLNTLPYWTDLAGARYYLLPTTTKRLDDDAYTNGAVAPPAGDQGTFEESAFAGTVNNPDGTGPIDTGIDGGIALRWPGFISLELRATLENLDDVAGSLGSYTGIQIWQRRPGEFLKLAREHTIDLVAGPGQFPFEASNTVKAESGDVFLPIFKVAATSMIVEDQTQFPIVNFEGDMKPFITEKI